jgi:hypothetical protein
MFRQVFIPTEPQHIMPPIPILQEWYGREMELCVVPVTDKVVDTTKEVEEQAKIAKWRKLHEDMSQKFGFDDTVNFDEYIQRMKELDEIYNKYPKLHLAGYKFNRDEANDYD